MYPPENLSMLFMKNGQFFTSIGIKKPRRINFLRGIKYYTISLLFLRWHYPDQVMGQRRISLNLSRLAASTPCILFLQILVYFHILFLSISKFSYSFRYTVTHIVIKHASPPIALEIGSAIKTPFTPNPSSGSNNVNGTTITTLRSNEKVIAYFAFPSP